MFFIKKTPTNPNKHKGMTIAETKFQFTRYPDKTKDIAVNAITLEA